MVKFIAFIVLFFFSVLSIRAQEGKLLASCCDTKPKERGRCTGSSSCSACSNCSRCGHCSNGGSCGVCARYSEPVRYTVPRITRERIAKSTSKSNERGSKQLKFYDKSVKVTGSKKGIYNYRSDDMLAVNSEILNLREGPGVEYQVIEVLEKHELLKLIAIEGEWLQVKVIETGNRGFVNVKFVYKI